MADLIRCRACGYIMRDTASGESCPACGVPRTSFEPFSDPIAPARRNVLNQHIHQVAVHFPQAFTLFLLGVLFAGQVLRGYPVLSERLFNTAWVLSIVLPFSILGGWVTGVFDAHVRYKRLHPRFLKLKIMLGIAFLLLATAESAMILIAGITPATIYLLFTLNVLAAACSLTLGKIGGSLACAAMGGK